MTLVDVDHHALRVDPVLAFLGEGRVVRVQKGVYESGFNFSSILESNGLADPFFKREPTGHFPEYGVADTVEQILAHFPWEDDPRPFCISYCPVLKADQEPLGGWRWHKWGPYIGEHTITTEYLYDEPIVEKVLVFHGHLLKE